MSFLQALILGIIQGITEFFPVSSSTHLRLGKHFLNISQDTLFFDLVCHTGTLIALLIFLRKDVWDILKSPKKILLYTLALLPLIPGYLLLKPLRTIDPSFVGISLLFTSLLLFLAAKRRPVLASGENFSLQSPKKTLDVVCIGVMQALAIIPGVSRSGATIAGARFCGWSWKEGARFSFLLSIPAILGGQILESVKLIRGDETLPHLPISIYFGGFLAALSVGWISVRFVFWIYEKEKVLPFAWYCLGVGLLAGAVFHGKAI